MQPERCHAACVKRDTACPRSIVCVRAWVFVSIYTQGFRLRLHPGCLAAFEHIPPGIPRAGQEMRPGTAALPRRRVPTMPLHFLSP